MAQMAVALRESINKHGIVNDPVHGRIYAFEVDGYGSRNIMDDSNVPSLLSAPFIGYVDKKNKVYQNTRKVILSTANPYFMKGPVFNSIGGPHVGPGFGWPMASIIRILTSDDDAEIKQTLGELVSTTDGLGLMHEGINSFDSTKWTRQW
jgi:meiotically up-regulated gene 157 (Mug157) protein